MTTPDKTFCSVDCTTKWLKENTIYKREAKCKECGKLFRPEIHGPYRSDTWCSIQCRDAWKANRKLEAEKRKAEKKVLREQKRELHNKKCKICGKLYVTKVIRSKYCSKKCLGLAHNKRAKERIQKGICGYCHKEFLYSGDHQRKYCTIKCFALALAEQGKEEVNINGVSWAFGTFILTLRETDPEAYHKIHVKLYHEMGPEWRMRFDRNLSKFHAGSTHTCPPCC